MQQRTKDGLRHIFQHKFSFHPHWDREVREKLKELFDLEDEELDMLYELQSWIASSGLELVQD